MRNEGRLYLDVPRMTVHSEFVYLFVKFVVVVVVAVVVAL